MRRAFIHSHSYVTLVQMTKFHKVSACAMRVKVEKKKQKQKSQISSPVKFILIRLVFLLLFVFIEKTNKNMFECSSWPHFTVRVCLPACLMLADTQLNEILIHKDEEKNEEREREITHVRAVRCWYKIKKRQRINQTQQN